MRIVANNRFDANDQGVFAVLSPKEKHIGEVLFEHPEVAWDVKKWAETAGCSTHSIRRFKKRLPELIGPIVEYTTKQCFLPVWFSLLRRASKDEDVKAKELLMKCLRVLKDEAPPEITQIFNITNSYNQQNIISDADIDRILAGHNPMEALKKP